MVGARKGSRHPQLECMGDLPFPDGYTEFMPKLARIIQQRREHAEELRERRRRRDERANAAAAEALAGRQRPAAAWTGRGGLRGPIHLIDPSSSSSSDSDDDDNSHIPEMPKFARITTSLKRFKFMQNHMHRFSKEQSRIGDGGSNPPWVRHPASSEHSRFLLIKQHSPNFVVELFKENGNGKSLAAQEETIKAFHEFASIVKIINSKILYSL